NQKLGIGYYTLEIAVTSQKLSSNSKVLNTLKDVNRVKENGKFYYTYGKFSSLEEAVKAQKAIELKGIDDSVIQKVSK
ncbi:MAG TPA: cell wall hydrolase, partial [Chryseobacterium sp.]|nr:cell wall hydrolase [Chryseobacterium sp.]